MKRAPKRLLIPDAPNYLYCANIKDMTKVIDLAGKSFGSLTVTSRVFRNKKRTHWECLCSCGTYWVVRQDHLESNHNKFCRCSERKKRNPHGRSDHKLYKIWEAIVRRCNVPRSASYKNYGGRGITICDEWRNDPVLFIEWCLNNGWMHGLHIDRADNNRGYSPDNCRFVSPKENSRNTRRNTFFTYQGQRRTLPEWAEVLGLNYELLRQRVHGQKWTFERAISQPKKQQRSKPETI